MAGSKKLSPEEITSILSFAKNNREKCLFQLALKTGFRISELLSLTVSQVVQYNKIRTNVTVEKSKMKGKVNSRTVPLHWEAQKALEDMGVLQMKPYDRLFPISRMHASRLLKNAVNKAQVPGKVSFHSYRKTFCQRAYEKLEKDLRKTQLATGHSSLDSLAHYLEANQEEVNKAILEI